MKSALLLSFTERCDSERPSRAAERRVFAAHTLVALGFATKPLAANTWSDFERLASSCLHNGTVAMFERNGFARSRRIGKHRWVVSQVVR